MEAAVRHYRAFLRQPGRYLDLCFPASPHPESSLVDVANTRDILQEALRSLPQLSRAELGRVVACLDAEFRRRTLPDPHAYRRLRWHGEWWHRRLYDGEFRWCGAAARPLLASTPMRQSENRPEFPRKAVLGHGMRGAVQVEVIVTSVLARTALSHRICTGIPRKQLGSLIAELAVPWMARQDSRLRERRGHDRLRAEGGGPGHQLVFTDRVIATLVVLRFQPPHAALGVLYGVDRSTITRAVHEIRPLLAVRGFAVPDESGLCLRTLAGVFAYADARGVELRLDGTEVRVRRPGADKPGRRAFVSGKRWQNTKKATAITDEKGRTLRTGAIRPGRMHDQTAVNTEGIGALFERHPTVKAKVDSGYKQWRTLQRYIGRREYYDDTHPAVAGLVSHRTAMR